MKKLIWLTIIFLGILFQSILSGGNREADVEALQKCRFVCVVDGDTIKVKDDGGNEVSVRMIGIDAPESRPNKRLELQIKQQNKDRKTILELGEKANAHLKELIGKNEFVYLEYDVQKLDKYERVLAYVYILDKNNRFVMLNVQMLKNGFAYPLTIPPNVKNAKKALKKGGN
ncbi:MAG: thermonuclease family protein [Victivallales bacterium]